MENQTRENKTIEVSEIVLEELRSHAKEKARQARHEWKQRGGWILCLSCEYRHAMRVNGHDRLMGIDEAGMPIIHRR
jgi:hypothetical protein